MAGKTYEQRLDEARRYQREYNRTQRANGQHRRAENGLRSLLRHYGQSTQLSEYKQQRLARLEAEGAQTPSLPTVSILNSSVDLEPADFYAGNSARREAGL